GDYSVGFLSGRGRRVIGRDFWKIGTREHEKETAVRLEHDDALRIGAIRLHFVAIWKHPFPRGERPGSDKLILERLLLADGARWQQRQSQCCNCRQTKNATTIH